jgi:EmrB/QacA subfamily drug resistance transporter
VPARPTQDPPATPSGADDDGALSGDLLRVILIGSFGSLLLNLGSTTVNVAVDTLMAEFRAPLSTVQWVVTGHLLALALVLPLFRWAVERLGSRRLYVACLLAYTATSAVCAMAWSAESLIAFRVVQGAVGGLLAPLAQALAAQLAGPRRIGRAIGVMSVPILAAPLLGPVLGGLVVQYLSWRWIFLFNAPLGVLAAWLAHRRLPPGTTATRSRLDFMGLALLSPGIGLFTFAVSSLARARALSVGAALPFASGVALILAFVVVARRRPDTALVDLRIFRHPRVGVALVAYVLASFGGVGTQLLFPLYYQRVRGASATWAGLLLAPQAIGMLVSLPQGGKLSDRFGAGRVVIAGVVTTLLGTLAFARAAEDTPYAILCLSLLVRGVGLGATGAPALSAAYRDLSRDEVPNGTTIINIVQRLAAPLGTAAMAMTLQRFAGGSGLDAPPPALALAFAHTFAVSAGLNALALFAGVALVRLESAGK